MRPIAEYTIAEYSPVSALLRAIGDIQTDNGLLWTPSTQVNPRGGAGIGGWEIHNRSSATVNYGIGFRIANTAWVAGQYTHAGTTFTDDTTDAQDAGATDFALETLTDNDGFIVACKYPFNALSINIGTAGAGATPSVHDMAYSNLAGTGWTTLTTTNAFVAPVAVWAAVSTPVIWVPPADWGNVAANGAAPFDNIPVGYYAIRIRATTANAGAGLVAAVATAMEVWRLFDLTEGLTDNSTATKNYFPAELYQQDISGVGAYISSVTALQSRVTAFIRER